jgi:hypothetical protein
MSNEKPAGQHKSERVTFRSSFKMTARIEAYRSWLEAREQHKVSTSRAVTKLLLVGLDTFERGRR